MDQPIEENPGVPYTRGVMLRRRPNLVGGALIVLALAVVSWGAASLGAHQGSRSGAPDTVSVTGTGSVYGTPDTVNFDLGVHTTASSASAALAANNAKMARLMASLRGDGVPAKDLATANLDLYPTTDANGRTTGFAVDNTLSVTLHQVAKAGSVIDAAVRATGNGVQMSGVTLSISDQSSLLASARAKAMASARRAASQLAQASGRSLGAVVRITDQGSSSPTVYPLYLKAAAASTAVQAGQQQLSDQVSVVYRLR